jgi:hypothetical protein
MSFNKIAFLEDVEKVHLKVGDTLSNTNIRKRLDEVV